MKDPKSLLFGITLCLYALYGIETGGAYFFGPPKRDPTFILIDRYDNSIFYWFLIVIALYLGVKMLIAAVLTKETVVLEPLTFKNINEYNNFKESEKSLRFVPFVGAAVGFFLAFIFWYIVNYNFNVEMNNCGLCQIDEDLSNLTLVSSIILFPIIFFKLFFKIMCSRLVNSGAITSENIKYMRGRDRSDISSNSLNNSNSYSGGSGADSSGSCGDSGGGGGGE
jgi:uncharacterized membrane protein YgcG